MRNSSLVCFAPNYIKPLDFLLALSIMVLSNFMKCKQVLIKNGKTVKNYFNIIKPNSPDVNHT